MHSTTSHNFFYKIQVILKSFVLPFINFALHDTVIKAVIIDHFATLAYTNIHSLTDKLKNIILLIVSTTSPLHKIRLSENKEKKGIRFFGSKELERL